MDFEEYKNTYFDGDEDKALHQLAYELYNRKFTYYKNKKSATNIVSKLTRRQESRYVDFLVMETNKNPTHFLKGLQNASKLMESEVTVEELETNKDSKFNPYKSKIKKTFFKALTGIAAVAIFMWIAVTLDNDELAQLGPYAISIFGSYIAIELTFNISEYFRFKKTKKNVDTICVANDGAEKNAEQIDDNQDSEEPELDIHNKKQESTKELTRSDCIVRLQKLFSSGFLIGAIIVRIIATLFYIIGIIEDIDLDLMAFMIMATIECVFVFLVYMGICRMIMRNKVKKLNFSISSAVCTDIVNQYNPDTTWGKAEFKFENGYIYKKRYQIHHHYGIADEAAYLTADLLDSIQIGDTCYLLQVGNSKKVYCIFEKNKYDISEKEFIYKNGNYYPIKDKSAAKVINDSLLDEYHLLSEEQKNNIDDVKRKNKRFSILLSISLLVSLLCIAISAFDGMLGLCVSIPVLIISLFALILVSNKNVKIVERLNTDTLNYKTLYKKSTMQNAYILCVFGVAMLTSLIFMSLNV